MGIHLIKEGLSDCETLLQAHWQVVVLRPPVAQYEASGWWEAHHGLADCPMDFMLHTDASGPRDFWAMRQEKTLALAQALQACVKDSGVPTGILCELA